MATKKDSEALPALEALPAIPMEHPTLHRIVNAFVSGTGKRELARKFDLPLTYIQGVIHFYLERFE